MKVVLKICSDKLHGLISSGVVERVVILRVRIGGVLLTLCLTMPDLEKEGLAVMRLVVVELRNENFAGWIKQPRKTTS